MTVLRWKMRRCAECDAEFRPRTAENDFCSGSCQKVFLNRRAVRGAAFYDLFMTLRFDRTVATKFKVWKLLWSRDLHDHPKRFISIGLWGSYLEHTPRGVQRFRAPWVRSFPASHQHRLTTPWGDCWTLVWVGRPERDWGFWHEGRFIKWEDYVRGSESALADKMKACD